ncbi:MAG: hypothetical protein NUV84_03880, partial [Candidatus Uhrbacteria bacterium]|nr:hypothetical protein [Candidatus Uhrbacteria bacterium]
MITVREIHYIPRAFGTGWETTLPDRGRVYRILKGYFGSTAKMTIKMTIEMRGEFCSWTYRLVGESSQEVGWFNPELRVIDPNLEDVWRCVEVVFHDERRLEEYPFGTIDVITQGQDL